ncbi:MAG: exodeoxyribonuclease V subunit gamma [Bacillota bacterium]|nr:exodeoxyribonuclease V subunit gamma [Bacillota bacterium]
MSLQIIYGRAGSGKSFECLKIASETWHKTDKKVFFIVPEQYSYETEKSLVEELGIISPKTVEVLSFKRLFYYVCNNVGGILAPRLTDTGKAILLRKAAIKCADGLKTLGKTTKYSGFTEVMATLFSEFKRYNNTPDSIDKVTEKLQDNSYFKLKMQDISMLYRAYEEEIAGIFTDPDDELTWLSTLLRENSSFFADSIFLIDEFTGFTPQEMGVIAEIAKQAPEIKITLCTDTLLQTDSGYEVFDMQIKTATKLDMLAQEYGIKGDKPLYMGRLYKTENHPEFAHLEKNLTKNVYTKYEDKTEMIKITAAMNYSGELEDAAEEIIRLTRDENYRYRDFMVVARNIDNYKTLVSSVFSRYGLPVYVSDKTSAAEETPAYALLCGMNIIVKNWSYEAVFSFLKTGYANLTDEETDLIENYIIRTGIRGTSWTNGKPWKYMPEGVDGETLAEIEKIRAKVIAPVMSLNERFLTAKTAKEYMVALVEFMTEEKFAEKVSAAAENFKGISPDISARYEQIYAIIISTMDEIEQVTGDSEEFTPEEFTQIFTAALQTHQVGIIPTSADSITVTDAERCGAQKCKVMFLIGVNDGVFPKIFSNEGIIKDEEREMLAQAGLQLSPDTVKRTFDESFIVYSTLLAPSERLYISYSLADNKGAALAPSGFIKKLKIMFPNISERNLVIAEKSPTERLVNPGSALDRLAEAKSREREGEQIEKIWADVEKWYSEHEQYPEKYEMIKRGYCYRNAAYPISKETLDGIYKDVVYTSVSRLETYKKCPFMYYAQYLLKANERETTEIRSVNIGNIMHTVTEKISLKVHDEIGNWNDVRDDWIEKNVELIAEEEIKKLSEYFDKLEPRQLWTMARLRRAIINSAKIIAYQLQSGDFMPMGYEIEFDDGGKYKCIEIDVGDKKIKLRGKIDRGDIFIDDSGRKFIRIVDYKSGNKEFDISDLYYGMNLQMAVYLDSLTVQENAVPAGMLYFRLYDPIVETEGDVPADSVEDKFREKYRTKGLLLADSGILEKMDRNIHENKSYLPVGFNKDGNFKASSKVATYEEFTAMNRYLRQMIKKMTSQMLTGDADIYPVKIGKTVPCQYCAYKQACHFDTAGGNRYNNLTQIETDEVWKKNHGRER